jgi:D-alanyl-lipoteichoic acid acyltransferase DltB (MBOAT superfamily)
MLFQTSTFFIFFALFYTLYIVFSKRLVAQNILILCGSYIFYGAWDERFLVLIALSTYIDFICALGVSGKRISLADKMKPLALLWCIAFISFLPTIDTSWFYLVCVLVFSLAMLMLFAFFERLQSKKKAYLFASVIINLGILGLFKYFNFFAENFELLLNQFGISPGFTTLYIVLPVGISFYTFQTMSYTIDVYRGKLKPSDNLVQVAAYISFFPQLVAGPIERGNTFLPQFQRVREITLAAVKSGAVLFLWGLFKKIVIADNLSPLADPIFSNPAAYTSGELLVALLAFTFQIYCDFSGYSDMARGIARSMGFSLMLNFNIPYVSRTPSEFWQRWHISLSSWLRDYLYIPLGGNRQGEFNTYRNLSLTMLLGGLWHGASWTFIAWGAFHGMVLVVYRVLKVDEWLVNSKLWGTVKRTLINLSLILIMFLWVVISWLLFRAESLSDAWVFFYNILSFSNLREGDWGSLWFFIWPLLAYQCLQLFYRDLEFLIKANVILKVNIMLFMICGILFLAYGGESAFIYFDF